MAESTIQYTKRNGSITISDATGGTPLSYTTLCQDGDFQYTVPRHDLLVLRCRRDFGATPTIRKGDLQPITGSFSVYLTDLTDATEATLMDFLQDGGFVDGTWVPTNGASAEVPTWNLNWVLDATSGAEAVTVTFPFTVLRLASIDESGDFVRVNVEFTSYAELPTYA